MTILKNSINVRLKRLIAKLCLAAGIVLTGAPQTAGATTQTGQITQVMQTGSRYFFFMTGNRDSLSCSCCNRWEITIGSKEGDAMIATMLTAFTTGKTVFVQGTGTCVAGAADTEGVALYYVLQ